MFLYHHISFKGEKHTDRCKFIITIHFTSLAWIWQHLLDRIILWIGHYRLKQADCVSMGHAQSWDGCLTSYLHKEVNRGWEVRDCALTQWLSRLLSSLVCLLKWSPTILCTVCSSTVCVCSSTVCSISTRHILGYLMINPRPGFHNPDCATLWGFDS